MWFCLVIGCFDWKIGVFQQTVLRGFIVSFTITKMYITIINILMLIISIAIAIIINIIVTIIMIIYSGDNSNSNL